MTQPLCNFEPVVDIQADSLTRWGLMYLLRELRCGQIEGGQLA